MKIMPLQKITFFNEFSISTFNFKINVDKLAVIIYRAFPIVFIF